MTKQIGEVKDLKEGRYVLIDGEPCKISKIVKSKPGKHGAMKARIEGIGVFDGQKRNLIAPVDQKIEIPIITKSTAQVLNLLRDRVQLMDMSTYETFELEIPEEFKDKLVQGKEVMYMDVGGKRQIVKQQ